MTELEYTFHTQLTFSLPVTEQVFALHCLPMEDEVQSSRSFGVELSPAAGYEVCRDGFGAWLVCGACRAPHESFTYSSHGVVCVDLSRRMPAQANPVLRCSTPLTQPEANIRALHASLPLAHLAPRAQAEVLNRAAAEALHYAPGVTCNETPAAAALSIGQGVCQDYAHLLLALARLSGFSARYCMGLIPGEGATHAWAELLLPEGWAGYDPTHGCEAGETYLRFAAGRDAADCRAERGVFKGAAQQAMQVNMVLKKR